MRHKAFKARKFKVHLQTSKTLSVKPIFCCSQKSGEKVNLPDSLRYTTLSIVSLTFSRSNGWVQAAAIAEAMPPRYHLCFLTVTLTAPDAGLAPSFNLVDILHRLPFPADKRAESCYM